MTRLNFIEIAGLLGSRRARALLGVILISASVQLGACNSGQIGNGNNDGGGGGDGGDMSDQPGYCSGKGPPIKVGDVNGTGGKCAGQVAATAFRYGLCTCQGLSAPSTVTIDAFDSTRPGPLTMGSGGSAGMNQNVNTSQKLSVGGNLQVAGALTVPDVYVGTDMLLASDLNANTSADIRRDAQINGDVKCNGPSGSLKIARTLTYPIGKTLQATSPMIGNTVRAAVNVPAPCDCAPNAIFDIAGYVQGRSTDNDNSVVALDPARLENFSVDTSLDFSCGRFYLNRIGGSGTLTWNVNGRTAVFVGGDVNVKTWTINLGPNGELDLFINGGLTSSAALNFGNINAPARVRVYMGGSRNINVAAGSVFGGNIYAPESALVPGGSFEVYGAVFVRSFNPSGPVLIHHDIAILHADDDCTPATGGTTSCSSCRDCGGQACKGTACGACTGDADCCAPLFCRGGQCIYEAG